MNNYYLKRREFLRVSSAGIAVLVSSSLAACQPSLSPTQGDQTVQAAETAPTVADTNPPSSPTSNNAPDLEISLHAIEDMLDILPDQATAVWRYVGEVVRGDPTALEVIENSYLGPTIHVRQGQQVRIHFKNELPVPSGIHWHGLLVPPGDGRAPTSPRCARRNIHL